MKNPLKSFLALTALVAVFALLFAVGIMNKSVGEQGSLKPVQNNAGPAPSQRESITFILGEDKGSENPYYTEALNYYRLSDKERTEYIVDTARSLLSVRNYLEENSPRNGQPWGLVNLVVHGNQWIGLSAPVVPGGMRTSVSSLQDAMAARTFLPLGQEVVDPRTEIVINGCGVGNNEELLETIRIAFGGQKELDALPGVSSTKYFTFYESSYYKGIPTNSTKYFADYWYTFYAGGVRPNDKQLVRQLEQQFPDADVTWEQALKREEANSGNEAYHTTFRVPVLWTVTYPSVVERPALETRSEQQAWLEGQPELLTNIQQLGIPLHHFQWDFWPVDYEFEDGTVEPAIKAVGWCTVLCVLKRVKDKNAAIAMNKSAKTLDLISG